MKNMPKSLHTITVLVKVAQLILESGDALTDEDAVNMAADRLGYPGYPTNSDDYGLKAKAVAQLDAGA